MNPMLQVFITIMLVSSITAIALRVEKLEKKVKKLEDKPNANGDKT